MKLAIALAALLAVTACTALTGNPAVDCPAANAAVLQAQQGVIVAEAYAKENPGKDADHAVTFARAYLATALAGQAAACAPAPVI